MFVCFYPVDIDDKLYKKQNEKYRFIESKDIICYIDKYKLEDMMKFILIDYCEVSVMGYDTLRNRYWCKIYNKKKCELHIELEIEYRNTNKSEMRIIPLLGSNKILNKFLINMNECMKLYNLPKYILREKSL